MAKVIALAVGSLAGGFARYYLAAYIHRFVGAAFPFGTLAVNLTGCFLIGFLSVVAEKKFLLSPEMRLLLLVGFCGAFTTFSTFIFESHNLMDNGAAMHALLNVMLSVVLGFFLFRLGLKLAEFVSI